MGVFDIETQKEKKGEGDIENERRISKLRQCVPGSYKQMTPLYLITVIMGSAL